MKKFFALAAVLMLCGFCVAQAKGGPKTVAQILDGGVTAIETELVPAAEAMPEDKFGFAPTNGEFKGVRTFGQQVKLSLIHIYPGSRRSCISATCAALGRRPVTRRTTRSS